MSNYAKLKELFGIKDEQESTFEDFDPRRKTLGESKEDDYRGVNAYKAIENFKNIYGYYPDFADESIKNIKQGSLEPIFNHEFPFNLDKKSSNPLADRLNATENWKNSSTKEFLDALKNDGLSPSIEDPNNDSNYINHIKNLYKNGLLPPEAVEKLKNNEFIDDM